MINDVGRVGGVGAVLCRFVRCYWRRFAAVQERADLADIATFLAGFERFQEKYLPAMRACLRGFARGRTRARW